MWLKLKDGCFFFGTGGITRFEPVDSRYVDPASNIYNTVLYRDTKRVIGVTETVDEIYKMLTGWTSIDG